jgi:hypothetical protein
MKTFNYRTLIFSALLSAGLFSCQTDLLDPTPKTQFSDKVVFDTPLRIDLQINSLYASAKNGNFLGGRAQIYGDIRANDFLNRLTNSVTGYQVWNQTLPETSINDVNNMWNFAYAAINQCNVFIKGMQDNTSKFVPPTFPADYATTTAVQRVAEARFVRAICYYYLAQYYARPYTDGNGDKLGLPLRLQAETSSTNNNLARATVAEVYAQILDDLNFAEQNLPANYGTGATAQALNVTRAHVNTAIAFKTRVYLSMGQYSNVITEANKIVSATAPFKASTGVAFALQPTFAGVFTAPQETLESILSFPFTAQDTPGGQNQLGYYFQSSKQGGNGEYSLNPAGIVANTNWKATDTRRTQVVADGTELFLRKYSAPSPYTDKAPVMRYSEVLLNLAEARVRSTNSVDAQAIALLNAVRGRSDATTIYTAANFANASELANALLLERNIEFLGEGLRNLDLMRLQLPIPGKGSISSVNPTDPNYIWPIPSGELAVNSLMTRN